MFTDEVDSGRPNVKLRLFISIFCVVECVVLLMALEQPAHAYVDPGSGLLIFQVVGSMLTGACFMLRRKLRTLFRLGPSVKEAGLQENPVHSGEAPSGGPDSSN
jgi:hypothetical protein